MSINGKRLKTLKKALELGIPSECKEAIFRQGFISGALEFLGAEIILAGDVTNTEALQYIDEMLKEMPDMEERLILASESSYNNLLLLMKGKLGEDINLL